MKALKIAATALLAALLLGSGLAAQALALARATVLDPGFYGEGARGAYRQIGRTVVRRLADAVLERAPAIVLRTRDREAARALAEQALPPEQVAGMLVESGPAIARYVFYGGELPVLEGSPEFALGETAVIKGMLQDGVWDALPDKPSFPAFMPFTPEWNLGYGQSLPAELWQARHWASLSGYASWLAMSAVVLFTGLIYLIWIRRRRVFAATAGALLAVNGLILLALAAAASYYTAQLSGSAAGIYPVSLAAGLFGPDWEGLFRAAIRPFRDIFALWSAASFSLGIAMVTLGIERDAPQWPWHAPAKPTRKAGPRHARPS